MSDEWPRRPPKRARRPAGEEKTASADEPEGMRARDRLPEAAGEDREGRYRGTYPEYPGMFPPPPSEGQPYMPPMYPPGGAPQWSHPYPPMNYGMYPPFPHGYPPHYPPGQGMPPPYYPEHPMNQQPPRYPGDMPPGPPVGPPYTEGMTGAPSAVPPAAAARATGESGRSSYEGDSKTSEASVDASSTAEQDYDDDSEKMPVDTSSSSRARLYVKSKIPTRREILDRRARKNAQSRSRAAKLRVRIIEIQNKPESERTEEEKELLNSYQYRRERKNDRSRERAIERKNEIERILAKPEKKRTRIETDFLETALTAKQRKNQGDRLRRQRIKQMKKAGHGPGDESHLMSSHHVSSVGFASGMSDIPMSPLPTSTPHHPSMTSPAAFASPGMMPNIAFPSPSASRRPGGQGTLEMTQGSQSRTDSSLPFAPPNQSHGKGDSPAARSQLHMPQQSSRVAQRRHPDGSMSISIGRNAEEAAEGSSFSEEARIPLAGEGPPSPDASTNAANVNLSDVSHLLLYGDNGDEQEGGDGDQRDAESTNDE